MEPPDQKASEAAVESIIGEVFSNVSFEEFERTSSTVSLLANFVRLVRELNNLLTIISLLANIRTFKWNFDSYHGRPPFHVT